MNKNWYQFGNPIKVKMREHYCYKCGTELGIIEHRKIVSQRSPEAQYYDFSAPRGRMVGPCEFIHKVFFCPKCLEGIEFVTQLEHEDMNIMLEKVKKHFQKQGKTLAISKRYETHEGLIEERITKIEQVKNMHLVIECEGYPTLTYIVPIRRTTIYERPYFFKTSKRKLIKFIKLSYQ